MDRVGENGRTKTSKGGKGRGEGRVVKRGGGGRWKVCNHSWEEREKREVKRDIKATKSRWCMYRIPPPTLSSSPYSLTSLEYRSLLILFTGLDEKWVKCADIGLPQPDIVLRFDVDTDVAAQRWQWFTTSEWIKEWIEGEDSEMNDWSVMNYRRKYLLRWRSWQMKDGRYERKEDRRGLIRRITDSECEWFNGRSS